MLTETSTLRQPMPEAHKILFSNYPREAWDGHPNFKEKTMNWMNAHQGFKALAEICREAVENHLDGRYSDEKLTKYLSYYGNMLVGNLHGHHYWEDRSYFPEILAADTRAAHGLDLLESDHEELDERLHKLTKLSNRVIQLSTLDPSQIREEAGALHPELEGLERLLERHLEDEEDLIVPIIIHYKLRG